MAYAGTPQKHGLALAAGPIEQSIVRLLSDGQIHSSSELLAEVYRGATKPAKADKYVRRARVTLAAKGYDIRQVAHRQWQMFAMPVLVIRKLAGKPVPVQFDIEPRYRTILESVSRKAGVSVEDIRGDSRKIEIARARWLVVEGLRGIGLSRREIAGLLGYADHTPVAHALREMAMLRRLGFGDAAILRGNGPRRCRPERGVSCRPKPVKATTDQFAEAWRANHGGRLYQDARCGARTVAR